MFVKKEDVSVKDIFAHAIIKGGLTNLIRPHSGCDPKRNTLSSRSAVPEFAVILSAKTAPRLVVVRDPAQRAGVANHDR